MLQPPSTPVITKAKRNTNWKDADLKALFFSLLLPYCQSGTVNKWRKFFSPGYKVLPGRSSDFLASVMTAIAQVVFDCILSFILPALTSVLTPGLECRWQMECWQERFEPGDQTEFSLCRNN
jgi:hypothetical protein